MELLNQPFTGQLGNKIIEFLKSPDYHTLNIIVAFAKNSGVLRLKDSLEKFRDRGGKVNVYVGIDLNVTSYEALTALLLCTNSLHIVHSETGQTFHTKIYQFLGDKKSLIVVGSHNLTGGGLWTNFESSTVISVNNSSPEGDNLSSSMNNYMNELSSLNSSFMMLNDQESIDKLLNSGYISKEVSQRVRLAKSAIVTKERTRLFGNGTPAPLPRINISAKHTITAPVIGSVGQVVPQQPYIPQGNQTIWFETKKLTGGSRNILDLSKKSLVVHGNITGSPFDFGDPKLMRGGVEFFGINPEDTDKSKNIILNFEGVDYANNTILYPKGENANGTWRLQIKGVNSANEKITDSFRAKGEAHYLVEKIVTFTKIEEDYYFLSVFPESELEDFQKTSQILAHNGSTTSAKWLGVL